MLRPNIIVIPVYKSIPDWSELISFNQCLKILHKHPICIITYHGLDISYYTNLLAKNESAFIIEYFNKGYFENIAGYNKLLLSKKFYERFKDFNYILLYQLDAWVFRDELNYWCQKGYDYIGAPWFEGWHETTPEASIIGVGNGGFSLRKVKNITKLIKRKNSVYVLFCIFIILRIVIKFIPILRRNIRIAQSEIFMKRIDPRVKNEDYQIMILSQIFKGFNIAPSNVALQFSFDANPEKLFKMNKNRLPFGCHAWIRFDKGFWEKLIF